MLNSFLNDLEYLVNIDSGSDCPDGTEKIASFFEEKFNDMGWKCEKHLTKSNGETCLICKNREALEYDLLMIGHTDTVFSRGTAKKRPFKIEDGKAYGPGAADMKNGCLLMYYVLKNLPKEVTDKLNIIAIFNPDEETGSLGSKEIYKEYAKKSKYAYIYESASSKNDRCTQRKGGCFMVAEFTGVPGHCGNVFDNGAKSAVSEMAKWIVELDKLQDKEKDTSVNIIVTHGGEKSNIVPDYAVIRVDIRFSRPEEVNTIEETLSRLNAGAKERNIKVNLTTKRIKAALVPDRKAKKYIEHIEKLAKDNNMEFKHKARGGHSDANYISAYGPVCIDGLGPAGANVHTDEEYCLIDSIIPGFELSCLLIEDLAQNK